MKWLFFCTCIVIIKYIHFLVLKKSESADIEEPKLENEGTNEEEHNVHISPTPANRKSPTGKTSKVVGLGHWWIF